MDITPENLGYILAAVAAILGGIAKVFAGDEEVTSLPLNKLGDKFRNSIITAFVSTMTYAQVGVVGYPEFTFASMLLYFEGYFLVAMGFAWGLPKGASGVKGGLLMLYNAIREKTAKGEAKPQEAEAQEGEAQAAP